jgi:hypothetical protein
MSDVPVKIVTDNRLELGVSVRTFFLAVWAAFFYVSTFFLTLLAGLSC